MKFDAATADWLMNLTADTWREAANELGDDQAMPLMAMDVATLAVEAKVTSVTQIHTHPAVRIMPLGVGVLNMRRLCLAAVGAVTQQYLTGLAHVLPRSVGPKDAGLGVAWELVLADFLNAIVDEAAKLGPDAAYGTLGTTAARFKEHLAKLPLPEAEP